MPDLVEILDDILCLGAITLFVVTLVVSCAVLIGG
jgi:hypothetical protein